MTDPAIRYRGRLIADMSTDELRAALVECMHYTQAQAELHESLMLTLCSAIAMDQLRQDQLFQKTVGLA